MANILIGVIKDLTEKEIRELKAKRIAGNVYGFCYTRYNKPNENYLKRCIQLQDIDAFPVIPNSYVAKYVTDHMIQF